MLGQEKVAIEQESIARSFIDRESEYNRACFEAICGYTEEALKLLKIGIEKKQSDIEWARQDPDFDFIRDDPRFKEFVGINADS